MKMSPTFLRWNTTNPRYLPYVPLCSLGQLFYYQLKNDQKLDNKTKMIVLDIFR